MVLKLNKDAVLFDTITFQNVISRLKEMETHENKKLYKEKFNDCTYSAFEQANNSCEFCIESSNIKVAAILMFFVGCIYGEFKPREYINSIIDNKTANLNIVKTETVDDIINLIVEDELEYIKEITTEYLNKYFPDKIDKMHKYTVDEMEKMIN